MTILNVSTFLRKLALAITLATCVCSCAEEEPTPTATETPMGESADALLSGEIPVSPMASMDDIEPFTAQSGEFTIVPFAVELFDVNDRFDVTTHSIRALSGGSSICASLAAFGHDFEIDAFVDGVRLGAIAFSRKGVAQGCREIWLDRNATIDVRVYQASGVPVAFGSNGFWNWLTLQMKYQFVAASNNDNIVVPSGSFTTIAYRDVSRDLSAQYDPATGQFRATTSGPNELFEICASAASFAQDFELDLFVNGQRERAFAVSHYGIASGCRSILLNDNDVVEVKAFQGSGSDMIIYSNYLWNWINVNRGWYPAASLGDIRTFTAESGVFTTVPFDSVLINQRSEYDPNTGRFTAYDGSTRRFCLSVTSWVDPFEVDLFINGVRENAVAVSQFGAAQGCREVRIFAGDYVEARVHHSTGIPMTFWSNGLWNWMTAEMSYY